MKTSNQIKKEIEKTRATIKALENTKKELINLDERRAAAAAGDREKHAELIKAFKENDAKITAAANEIYINKIILTILNDNYKCAVVAECLPLIKTVLEKYNNKPYGEKTSKKIKDEIFCAGGFHVYITKNNINIRYPNDYYNDINAGTPYNVNILTNDNKINAAALDEITSPAPYTENPKKAANEIIKKYEKALAALDAFNKAINEYNDAAPAALYKNHAYINLYNTIL